LLSQRVFAIEIIPSVERDIADLYFIGLAIDAFQNIRLDQPNGF